MTQLSRPGKGTQRNFFDDLDLLSTMSTARPSRIQKRRKLVGISLLLLIGILFGVVVVGMTNKSSLAYQSQKITQGNLAITVNATGPLQATTYTMNFMGTGKLSEINVKVGQYVKKNQVLARLDPTSLLNAYNVSQATVSAAQTTLNATQANYAAITAASQTTVKTAQEALNNAIANQRSTQTLGQQNIASARSALKAAQENARQVQQQTEEAISSAQKALEDALLNQAAVQKKVSTELQNARAEKDSREDACHGDPACIALAEMLYNQAVSQANAQNAAAQNAVNKAQSELMATKGQATTQNNNARSQINTAQAALHTAINQANAQRITTQNQVDAARRQLNNVLAQTSVQNTAAQGQAASARSNLDVAQAQLTTAHYNRSNIVLYAPHEGTVVAVNGSIGGIPGSGGNAAAGNSNTFVQIVDLANLQIQASVNEADISKVAVNDRVRFSVSAYPGQLFDGTVSTIAPQGQTVSGVVTYPVTVQVDTTRLRNAMLLPGMTASVSIILYEHPGATLLPASALNFAQSALNAGSEVGKRHLITQKQATAALNQSQQMVQRLQQSNPATAKEQPMAAFVLIADSAGNAVVKPVVVGLSNETSYEVLWGLANNDVVLTGAQPALQRGLLSGNGLGAGG